MIARKLYDTEGGFFRDRIDVSKAEMWSMFVENAGPLLDSCLPLLTWIDETHPFSRPISEIPPELRDEDSLTLLDIHGLIRFLQQKYRFHLRDGGTTSIMVFPVRRRAQDDPLVSSLELLSGHRFFSYTAMAGSCKKLFQADAQTDIPELKIGVDSTPTGHIQAAAWRKRISAIPISTFGIKPGESLKVSEPDEKGYVESPLDPTAYVSQLEIKSKHTPADWPLKDKELRRILEDYAANRVRWTRPLSKTGKPNPQRKNVHLNDWLAYCERRKQAKSTNGWSDPSASEIAKRKSAIPRKADRRRKSNSTSRLLPEA